MTDSARLLSELARRLDANDDIQVRGLNSDVLDRLRETVESFGNAAKLSKAIGVSPSSLSDNLSGRREPRASLLAAIARATGRSLDWIMFGDAPNSVQSQSQSFGATAFEDVVALPFYDIRVSAGPGANPLQEMPSRHVNISRHILDKLGLKASNTDILTVSGDSAEPTMSEGDFVLVDRSAIELRDGGMYVIGVDDDVVVKRVERLFDRSIRLISDNPRYSPQIVPASDVDRLRVIGRVRWAIHEI